MKKLIRYIKFYLGVYFLKFVSFFLSKIKFYILPNFSKEYLSKILYSKVNKSFYYSKTNNKFDVIKIDASNLKSELCKIGEKFNCEKSPYSNRAWHRHPYTGIYDIFFYKYRNKVFNFAEIGIGPRSTGLRMFREYFKKARIFGFELKKANIKFAKKLKLKKSYYYNIDVRDSKNIYKAFSKTKRKFEIIVDDSNHYFPNQINIIKNCADFLLPNGILVIEDIFIKKNVELEFIKHLGNSLKKFNKVIFVDCNHINKYSKHWNNDKLCILIKS